MSDCEWGHDETDACDECGGCRECGSCRCGEDDEPDVYEDEVPIEHIPTDYERQVAEERRAEQMERRDYSDR